jgi:hypothetical protein
MAALLYHDNFVEIQRTDHQDPDVMNLEERLRPFYEKYTAPAAARISALVRKGKPDTKFFYYQASPNTTEIDGDHVLVSFCNSALLNPRIKLIIFCILPEVGEN